ncbi:N-6 DNA methylase [Halomicrobium urmianum]|uniref:N-6 DNA methylase n=1 Tax=Halomicrobium urmianum TaxID=1586233 RepID=UPI001CD9605C|nr:N-6 DNA methylase [Halomicrobium urmianum]
MADERTIRRLRERVGRDSDAHRVYRERVSAALAGDGEDRRAFEAWRRAFVAAHGDVLGDLDASAEAVFADRAYYGAVVDRLVDAVEGAYGVEVMNRGVDGALGTGDLLGDAADGVDALADLAALDRSTLADLDADALRDLYEGIVPREVRLALGEYHTPRGVADLAVDALAVDPAEATYLDPGCGSGAFLAACVDRVAAAASDDPAAVVDRVTDTVFGIDLSPVAVASARLTYLLALAPHLDAAERVTVPVYHGDALGLVDAPDEGGDDEGGNGRDLAASLPPVDCLVGNPPWITWDRLPDRLQDRWRDRSEELDLFPHEGAAALLGHGNDDLSVPFVWVCIDRYLDAGGEVSVVLKRDVTKGPAGRLFRSLRAGDQPLALSHVHDFGTLSPFGDQVAAGAAVFTLRAEEGESFPAPATAWERDGAAPDYGSGDAVRELLAREGTALVPVDPEDPASAWIRRDAERAALGDAGQEIRHGLKDDAEDVFSVDRDLLDRIELDLVYPYLKSRHVVRYGHFGHDLRLVPMREAHEDNEARLRERYPETYRYLRERRGALEERSSSWLDNGPFYNVFGLGEYTWADYRVAWCRLGYKPHFAVVSTADDPDLGEKQVIPGDHYMFVATDDEREAHFLCALLNSAPYQRSLRDVAGDGKASLTKSTVSRLALPDYPGTERAEELAERSMAAHDVVADHDHLSKRAYRDREVPELAAVQAQIDDLAESLVAERNGRQL